MSGWGAYTGRHRTSLGDQDGVFCIEADCGLPATQARPITEPWLIAGGVIMPGDAVEWVCAEHLTPAPA